MDSKLFIYFIHFLFIGFHKVMAETCMETLKRAKPVFNIHFDQTPHNCPKNIQPNTCAQATECTQSTGVYKITENRYNNRTFSVFCDNDNFDGDWLYILRRNDGSVRFNRTWDEYVEGFGNAAGEHWLGLENIYALTNFYGPQELVVFLEDFERNTTIARYDNFAIADKTQNYRLKSLGRYWGTAGDSLFNHLGAEFSTIDVDHDQTNMNCARLREGGFWFSRCGYASPTAAYMHGFNQGLDNNSHWHTFRGDFYSLKTIIFMIRRQNAKLLL
ncbi:angiopoietin-related protein 2-like [Cochliomyia hominivorax]